MKDKRLPYIIASIVLVFILACGVILVHMPLSKQLQEKRSTLNRKQNELRLVRFKIQELAKLKKDYEKIREQASILAEKIPQDPNVPDVISLMGKFALESGITVSKVEFQDQEMPAATGAASNPNVTTENNSVNDIDIKKCTLTLNGRYESMIHFFNAIKSSPRLFGIEKITISQDGSDGKKLKLDLSLAYFNYKAGNSNQIAANN